MPIFWAKYSIFGEKSENRLTKMTKINLYIPKFLTESVSIWLFLISMLVSSLIFAVLFEPARYMHILPQYTSMNLYLFTVIQVFAAFFILVISRFSLYFFQRKHPMEFLHFVIWIVVEVLFVILVLTIMDYFMANKAHLLFSDYLWRVTINLFSVAAIPYIIVVLLFSLSARTEQINSLKQLVETTAALVPADVETMNFYDRGGKLAFSTRRANVLYVEAADNYCNIHYLNGDKEDTFILHNSMKHLDNSDKYKPLLRCHRGYMVNSDNVKLLRKNKDGLVIELQQIVRTIPVSRTYNENVVRFFSGMLPSADVV